MNHQQAMGVRPTETLMRLSHFAGGGCLVLQRVPEDSGSVHTSTRPSVIDLCTNTNHAGWTQTRKSTSVVSSLDQIVFNAGTSACRQENATAMTWRGPR